MKIPLLADKSMEVAKAYGVLKDDEGIAFRGLFVIDGKQNLRQVCQTGAIIKYCNVQEGLVQHFGGVQLNFFESGLLIEM